MSLRPYGNDPPRNLSHYRLIREIGRGAMGIVFEAVDRRDRSTVAVKMLHPHLTQDRSFRERFEREAHICALLRSPYTVHLLDYGVQSGHYFMVMEFVDAASLGELLDAGPLPPNTALRICTQVARALQEAEVRGIVHRDIKPENILVGDGDAVKVTDFGIARELGGGTLTSFGAFVGTPAYAAPEQFSGIADHRSDIWALGAVLYHAVTGRPPFGGGLQEISRAVREQPPDLHKLPAGLPDVAAIIGRCLAKDPQDRFQSAAELAFAMERAADAVPDQPVDAFATRETETVATPGGGSNRRGPPSTSRIAFGRGPGRPRWIALAAGAAALIGAVAVAAVVLTSAGGNSAQSQRPGGTAAVLIFSQSPTPTAAGDCPSPLSDGSASLPLTAEEGAPEAAIVDALNCGNAVWVLAVRSGETSALSQIFAGSELASIEGDIAEYEAKGQHRVARLISTSLEDATVDGDSATAKTREVWSIEDRMTGSGELVAASCKVYPNEYDLNLAGGRWRIVAISDSPTATSSLC